MKDLMNDLRHSRRAGGSGFICTGNLWLCDGHAGVGVEEVHEAGNPVR